MVRAGWLAPARKGVMGSQMAKLYFTHGTMGAQKTTDLLATAYNFEEHGGKVFITKPAPRKEQRADDSTTSESSHYRVNQ